jgi:hypothetical protein
LNRRYRRRFRRGGRVGAESKSAFLSAAICPHRRGSVYQIAGAEIHAISKIMEKHHGFPFPKTAETSGLYIEVVASTG